MAELIYNGTNDVFLDNNDVLGFANESDLQKDLTITLLNSTTSSQPVHLFPSIAPDGTIPVITDGTIGGITGFTAEGDTHSIEFFKAYVLRNPTRVVKVRIEVNDVSYFSKVFSFRQHRLGQKPIDSEIKLGKYVGVYQNNDKILHVTDGFQLDDCKRMITTIPPAVGGVATRIAITFEFGFSLNNGIALESKAKIAMKDPAVSAAMANKK